MTDKEPQKVGRPVGYRKANPANKVLTGIRVTEGQLESYKQVADKAGKSLSAWVKGLLDAEVKRRSK